MQRIGNALAAAVLTGVLLGAASTGLAEDTLHLTTEEYAPFNFDQDGDIAGLGADQVEEIMRRSGIAHDVTLMAWSRAIGLAREKPMTCVFTTAHTVDRDTHFKWVEPATAYRTGTQTGDYTVELLRNAGFSQIDLARDLDLTLKKLLSGRVDLMAVSESYVHRKQKEGVPVEEVAVLHEQVFSIACSLKTPDGIVARMQQALTAMIADGTQAEILARYSE